MPDETHPSPAARASPRALRIVDLARPHWKSLTLAFVAVLGETLADILEPWPIKIVIDNVVRSKAMPGLPGRMVAATFGHGQYAVLNFAVAAVAGIAVVGAVSAYFEKYLTTSVGQWVGHDLRRTLYHHIQRLSLAEHDKARTGDLITRVTSDIEAIQDFINSALLGMLVSRADPGRHGRGHVLPQLAFHAHRPVRDAGALPRRLPLHAADQEGVARGAQAGRRTAVGRAGSADVDPRRHRVRAGGLRADSGSTRRAWPTSRRASRPAASRPSWRRWSTVLVAIGTCLVLWYGARLAHGRRTHRRHARPLPLVPGQDVQADARSLEDDRHRLQGDGRLRAHPGSARHRKPWSATSPGARRAPTFSGRIEFDRVSFSYDADKPILKDVSLTIEAGQVAAIVGPSGTGKTTIVSLIPRFYDPTSGRVVIEGADIRRYQLKSLRDQMSFVLQDTLLFRATIWENIAYGKPGASSREIRRAAELANAREFIEEMPDGYDTMVGERGVVALGRPAPAHRDRPGRHPRHADPDPRRAHGRPRRGVRADRDGGARQTDAGRTSIVIAHHLGTIRHADMIFVINDCELAEQGTHDELMARNGVYADLYGIQTPKEA